MGLAGRTTLQRQVASRTVSATFEHSVLLLPKWVFGYGTATSLAQSEMIYTLSEFTLHQSVSQTRIVATHLTNLTVKFSFVSNNSVPICTCWMSCTRLRILLNTICRRPGFNSLRTPLNHGAEQVSNETLKQTQQRNWSMLPRAGKLH